MCPFIPVQGVSVQDCIGCAKEFGRRLAQELDVPVFLYGKAAEKGDYRITLPQIRAGEYEGLGDKVRLFLLFCLAGSWTRWSSISRSCCFQSSLTPCRPKLTAVLFRFVYCLFVILVTLPPLTLTATKTGMGARFRTRQLCAALGCDGDRRQEIPHRLQHQRLGNQRASSQVRPFLSLPPALAIRQLSS